MIRGPCLPSRAAACIVGPMGPALFRPLVALVLLVGFFTRTVGAERLHQCPQTAAAQGAGHGEHEHGHRSAPSGADRCECVGQSCTSTIAAPAPRIVLITPVVALAQVAIPAATAVARPAVPHLLPFAHGPPA